MLNRILTLLLILFFVLLVFNCSQSPQGPDKENTADLYTVYLTGKVMNKDGSPVALAQVRLSQYGLTATTNSSGVFLLTSPSGSAKAPAKDTLEINKDDQDITSQEITQFIDTLPDIFIVQRDIYGSIATSVTDFSKIEAVIRESGDSIPKTVVLWFNKGVNGYSGFVYFPYTSELHSYVVYVNVYSADSLLIGRSDSVVFPSTAGNIQIPLINPLNAVPFASAGADTVVSIKDTIRLHGTGGDHFDSAVVKWEWDIGGKGVFVKTKAGDTAIIAPAVADSHFICILRVTDKDSNKATDTVVINVLLDPPTADAGRDTTVRRSTSYTIYGNGTDVYGSISKYRFDSNGDGIFEDSSTVSREKTFTAPATSGSYNVILQVQDDDENVKNDTMVLHVNYPPNAPLAAQYFNGDSSGLRPTLRWSCSDFDNSKNILKYDVYFSQTNPPAIKVSTAQTDTFYMPSSGLAGNTTYYWGVVASDSLGDTSVYENWYFIAGCRMRDTGPAGGLIFYDKGSYSDGWRYLEAAPNDQSTGTGTVWGCNGTEISGADSTGVGTGAQNTIDIGMGCLATGTAADVCANLVLNGYSDWYLPSRDELTFMYQNLHIWGFGGFNVHDGYFSSSELNAGQVWYRNFSVNSDGGVPKDYPLAVVRAVRAF